jgi:hypothetical protein
METTEELLVKLIEVAQEQLRWQRAFVLPEVRKTIDLTLTTSQLRRAYEMCDGTKQSVDIAAAVEASKQSISAWTRRWRDLGIAFEVEGRRIKHLMTLSSLGLPLEIDDEAERKRSPAATS